MLQYKKKDDIWQFYAALKLLQSKLFNADTQYPKILRQVSFPKNGVLKENWAVKDERSTRHKL